MMMIRVVVRMMLMRIPMMTNDENLLAVSQTNWGVISGTAGNGGDRQKLKC